MMRRREILAELTNATQELGLYEDKGIMVSDVEYGENYVHIAAEDIKYCNESVYCGDDVIGCRISEIGTVCNDFNNPDEPCYYRQLLYYKNALKEEKFQHSGTKGLLTCSNKTMLQALDEYGRIKEKLDRVKSMLMDIIQTTSEYDNCY